MRAAQCVAVMVFVAISGVGISSPARADLTLCNMTASRVGVAIGYKRAETWVSEGWWNVLSNSCETIFAGALEARYYYIHAVDYDRGGAWSGKANMCTSAKSFRITSIGDCRANGFGEAGFFEVDTGEARDHTIWLTDPDRDQAANEQQ